MIRLKAALAGVAMALTVGACATTPPAPSIEPRLTAAVSSEARPAADRARDEDRHPAENLTFWGLKPGTSILEVQPGGGYWTAILAPFARDTGGTFSVTAPVVTGENVSQAARDARANFERQFVTPGTFGPIRLVDWGATAAPPPAASYDFILTSRSVHGWIRGNSVDRNMGLFFTALKPGGILAVEQHRANPDVTDPARMGETGYVSEAFVIAAAERAGFRLAARSEINANPADTKDHPFGVWTLPPVSRTSPAGQPPNPNFDRAIYDAIGESDRMTLRFVKPG